MTPEELLRYRAAGPRYTSYPTVPQWTEAPVEALASRLQADRPTQAYVHIPFCKEQCTFCGCNMVVAGRREPGERYLSALQLQLDALGAPRATERIHLGGGTPTWYGPDELVRLYQMIFEHFIPAPGAEISVEADPDVTTTEQIDTLAELGVNRLSLGVQSFDDGVLQAVQRPQSYDRIAELMTRSRERGIDSINLDLMYGLPTQSTATFLATLHKALELRPTRLAVFGYAHVPWLKRHQRKLDEAALPGPLERARQYLLAQEVLTDAGYIAIGLDHFALPDDELAQAYAQRKLYRNFMGYTTRPDLQMIGLGMSAISEFPDAYSQQLPHLSKWWKAVEAGTPFPWERGMVLRPEDLLRRHVIYSIMCNLELDEAEVSRRFGINVDTHFAEALQRLRGLEDDGVVERSGGKLRVNERLLVRHVAMAFDAYYTPPSATPAGGPRYSQTI